MSNLSIQRFSIVGLIAISTAAAPAFGQRFQGGKTAFLSPDGKWVKARIEVGPEQIQVFQKRGKKPDGDTLVAKFDRVGSDQDVVHRQTAETQRRVKRGIIFGVTSGVILAGVNIGLRLAADEVDERASGGTARAVTGQVRDKLPLATLIAAGGFAALAIKRGMGKVDRPRRHLRQGTRDITLRIPLKDLGRFDMAMDRFGAVSKGVEE